MDETTTKLGLLIETAEAHQELVDRLLERLQQHTLGLDGVVRQEIRRVLAEELRELHVESTRIVDGLRRAHEALQTRVARFSLRVTGFCVLLTISVIVWSIAVMRSTPSSTPAVQAHVDRSAPRHGDRR